jgi:hypothetical protein
MSPGISFIAMRGRSPGGSPRPCAFPAWWRSPEAAWGAAAIVARKLDVRVKRQSEVSQDTWIYFP